MRFAFLQISIEAFHHRLKRLGKIRVIRQTGSFRQVKKKKNLARLVGSGPGAGLGLAKKGPRPKKPLRRVGSGPQRLCGELCSER